MDYYSIQALIPELEQDLLRQSFRAVRMPDWHHLVIEFANRDLHVNLHPQSCLCWSQEPGDQRPSRHYPFARFLDQHLRGSWCIGVHAVPGERILRLRLGKVQGAQRQVFHLMIELMGRSANVLLLDRDRQLLAVLKENWDLQTMRPLLVGQIYEPPPPQGRREPQSASDFTDADWARTHLAVPPWLMEHCVRSPEHWDEFSAAMAAQQFAPALIDWRSRLVPVPVQMEGMPDPRPFSRMSDAVQYLAQASAQRGDQAFQRERTRLLERIDREIRRQRERLDEQRSALKQAQDTHALEQRAHALHTWLWSIEAPGEQQLEDPRTGELVRVEIPPDQSPQDYLQECYQRLRKLRRSVQPLQEHISARCQDIAAWEQERYYADCTTELDGVLQMRERLFPRPVSGKRSNSRRRRNEADIIQRDLPGFILRIGLSTQANDRITLQAGPEDFWMHVKDRAGAHLVLIRQHRRDPDEALLELAASLAALYSRANETDEGIDVDITRRKHVRKPPGARAGAVFYTDFCSMHIRPEQRDRARQWLNSTRSDI